MDPRLQDMLDHHEIRKTLATYCHACDRADEALMASTYTGADSFDDHGLVRAAGPEYARQMKALVVGRTEAVSHIKISVPKGRSFAQVLHLLPLTLGRWPGAALACDKFWLEV